MSRLPLIASRTSAARTSGGSASAWVVDAPGKEDRRSPAFTGAVGSRSSAICRSVTASRSKRTSTSGASSAAKAVTSSARAANSCSPFGSQSPTTRIRTQPWPPTAARWAAARLPDSPVADAYTGTPHGSVTVASCGTRPAVSHHTSSLASWPVCRSSRKPRAASSCACRKPSAPS
ncbi:hypothetical protein [Streptomyces noursei]|uniref:hypothetical protein n=1 Tax=Streptomyces noursei TaxID=1971 RepID=UPI0007CD66E3|nr:hypothetical protein A4V12_19350 [Streptomyces noursei]